MDILQWINLPKDNQLLGTDMPDVGRMGGVEIKLRFANSKAAIAKYRVTPRSSNLAYEADEAKRHGPFRLRQDRGGVVTDVGGDVEADATLLLPACGANKYVVEGLGAKGEVVETADVLVAQRLLQVQVVRMAGQETAAAESEDADVLSKVIQHLWNKDHAIKVVRIDKKGAPTGTMSSMPLHQVERPDGTLESPLQGDFLRRLRRQFTMKRTEIGFVVCWVPWLAIKKRQKLIFRNIKLEDGVASSSLARGWSLNVAKKRIELTLPRGSHLWHGLDPLVTKQKSWLAGAGLLFFDANGKVSQQLLLDASHAEVIGSPDHARGGHRTFCLKVDHDWDSVAKRSTEPSTLVAVVDVVEGWYGGWSFPGQPVVAIAEESGWEARSTADKTRTLTHELGHRFGLAANGNLDTKMKRVWSPNGSKQHYYDQETCKGTTHQGRHCGRGMRWDAAKKKWSGKPGCVMFGSSGPDSVPGFCDSCSLALRKADLSNISR